MRYPTTPGDIALMNRRTFLASVSGVSLVGTAGCTEDDGADDSTTGDDGVDDTTTGDDGGNADDWTDEDGDTPTTAEQLSPEAEQVRNQFGGHNYFGDHVAVSHLVVSGENVLTRESVLESLELQRTALQQAAIADTLTDPGMVGLENAVATAVVRRQQAREEDGSADTSARPPLEDQIEALKALSAEEFQDVLLNVLDPEVNFEFAGISAFGSLPMSYQPGTPTAEMRRTLVFQVDDGSGSESSTAAQSARDDLSSLVEERFDEAFLVEYTRQPPTIELTGNVTHDDALAWVQAGTTALEATDTVYVDPDGNPDVETPLTVLRGLVDRDDEFASLVDAADTTDDGVPDRNLPEVYDAMLATDPNAKRVLERVDGEYEALRLLVAIRANETKDEIVADLENVGGTIENQSESALDANVILE